MALTGGSSIDLGGIAKGYTSSRVIQIMKDCGIEHAIVNLGGNVQVLGTKTDGSDWRVAIQNPASENSYLGILSTADKAVITSVSYTHLDVYKRQFGDGRNDIEMLEAVGTGVAMGNAIDEVKARADVICKSVEEDGVYHYCLEKKLIKC